MSLGGTSNVKQMASPGYRDYLGAQLQADAEAKKAAEGSKPMAVREQLLDSESSASGVTASGNESDQAGTPLGARRRAASRVLVG